MNMKKYFKIFSIILIIIFVIIFFIKHNQNKNENRNSFYFPKQVESKILKSLEQDKENKNESYLLSSLLKSGEWVEISLPETDYERDNLKKRFVYWEVKDDNGIIVVENKLKSIEKYGYNIFNVDNGFFLMVNTLEWGGALYFYPENHEEKYKIHEGYIWDLDKNKDDIYAFQSIKYPPGGKLLKIKKNIFNKWVAREIEEESIGVPLTFTFSDSNTIYLVTYKKLIKLVDNKVKEVIVEDAFWNRLFPESSVYKDRYVYIGMTAGIAKVNVDNG